MISLYWSTRSKTKKKKMLEILKDFGMAGIYPNFAIGLLGKKEREELRPKIQELLTGKTDHFIIIALCRKCRKSFLDSHQNIKIKNAELFSFEKDFEIY